jgi:hypothetical protein
MKQTCVTCNNSGEGDPRDWHYFQHPFRGAGDTRGSSSPFSRPESDEQAATVVRGPFDPVLRQALIDKGVLTVDDLRNAEAKILVVSGEFHAAVREAMSDDGTTTRSGGE